MKAADRAVPRQSEVSAVGISAVKGTTEQVTEQVIVTAEQMRQIESRLFDAGMPVAALMEKVGGLISSWFQAAFPRATHPQVGVLVGPGHNGGDALVVARELHLNGYQVQVYAPFGRMKELTAQHTRYAASLGISFESDIAPLGSCNVLIDGLFGFGLERAIEGDLAEAVESLNQWPQPCVSIDLPSGIHTDLGAVLGTAIKATYTLCLGLWKRAFFQESALPWVGKAELIPFGIPQADVEAVLGQPAAVQRLTSRVALSCLPLPRPLVTHKYRVGSLLLVAGSRAYGGAALLAALGARASGVGMLTLVVPDSLKLLLHAQLPEALIVGCPETPEGAIAQLPDKIDPNQYSAIACGPGLSRQAGAIFDQVIASHAPLVLDADGLNLLAERNPTTTLAQRSAPTVLTPHMGEFRRLFPEIADQEADAGTAAVEAATRSGAVMVLKGARSAIAHPSGSLWYLPASTPALARGGSGDVLTGLVGGLLAQKAASSSEDPLNGALEAALGGVWWHAQAAQAAAAERTTLGVDPATLAEYLNPTLADFCSV